ncbi:MAG: hypothetical protein M3Y72_23155 [Acidobacteriota bacterium]|nr:hypothetical protein [Acidobacteriota bacterium]
MIPVPDELTEYKQWVVWRRVHSNGRTAKMPISAWSGKAASCDKPETWASFKHACFALRRHKADGIGFVFTEADPFCGIDLDKCRGKDGRIEENSLEIVETLNSYTEVSPSGDGLHIVIKGLLAGSGRRAKALEIYYSGRYFTITGKHLGGTPGVVEERQSELDALLRTRFSAEPEPTRPANKKPNIAADNDLLARAMEARSGARFMKLWSGDISDYGGDHSRADAALCRMLAFWTGGDGERVDRLFRMSGLMRDKWDRKTGGDTYGMRTIGLSSFRQKISSDFGV